MKDESHIQQGASYGRFVAMIATSTLAMFALTYLNSYASDHIFWSQTRFWMALVMGAAMIAVTLCFMWGMYLSRRINFLILLAAACACCQYR
ncbi:hypothetical protein KNJ79_20835 (plasmid) [Sphingopyxis indica]|uniref:hypothetical protein n=1 Tax=Sphingopyxis indica TaxID=436663 RepID=UPI00293905F7|nr:hypothetical protein [Sphingopyxis indica]WOF45840.1 hypothetical protein KNJ79_20835 [Sphingopyxis indica]